MIELQKVTKSFQIKGGGEKIVLNSLDFTIGDNEFMCLLGPSGCGKSTMLRLISGLDKATSGSIKIDGTKVTEPNRESSFVFQNYALFPWMTVIENVEFGMKINKMFSAKERHERAIEHLEYVNLMGFENSYIHQLSGGMKQRVAIARALVTEPKILFMDEPFGALDTFTRISLQDLLLDIKTTRNVTIVFVTHDIDEAIYLADKIAIMNSNTGLINSVINVDKQQTRNRTGSVFNAYRDVIYKEFNLCSNLKKEDKL
ncbi:ABC transporter ATP-binding protein [Lacrimispora defluvii]|uniref:ABC transporter ATP-binding protein n=1 Tax=Lacrimispora defluvii TaxID=2719233 RepID=A0ABX1VKY8_9FIRM|nr:ABC transporter ATP-binding protein [Lacrimispora defluvii]NNJ28629.1 ABC transporter ATP-binding protein [Lacrimispora defluvii]